MFLLKRVCFFAFFGIFVTSIVRSSETPKNLYTEKFYGDSNFVVEDGTKLAVVGPYRLTLWSIERGDLLAEVEYKPDDVKIIPGEDNPYQYLPHLSSPLALNPATTSPLGLIAIPLKNSKVLVVNSKILSDKKIINLPQDEQGLATAFSSDGKFLLVVTEKKLIEISLSTLMFSYTLDIAEEDVNPVAVAYYQDYIVMVCKDEMLLIKKGSKPQHFSLKHDSYDRSLTIEANNKFYFTRSGSLCSLNIIKAGQTELECVWEANGLIKGLLFTNHTFYVAENKALFSKKEVKKSSPYIALQKANRSISFMGNTKKGLILLVGEKMQLRDLNTLYLISN